MIPTNLVTAADEGLSNPFGNLGPAGGRGSVNQRSDNRPAQARAVREACRTPLTALAAEVERAMAATNEQVASA
jgi:hypothetical protein